MPINLLPEQLKKKKNTEWRQNFRRVIRGFVFFWLILGVFWLFLIIRAGYFKRKLFVLDEELKTSSSQLKDIDGLIQRKKELDEFLIFLNQYFKKGISWSEKLTMLSELVPREVWLKEISLRKETKEGKESVFLDVFAAVGYLDSDEEMLNKINNFLEALKNNDGFFKDFDNLSLAEIKKVAGKDKVMDFKFSLFLKQWI